MTLPHIEYSQEDTLAGKVAIVTGAGGGFGEAIARLFASRGARVPYSISASTLPSVFAGVRNEMQIAQQEVFGPVLSVIRFTDDDEAYSIANDTPYGLAAGVWTSDMARAFTAARRLRAGTVWTNTYRAVSYMVPFGGFKNSGQGRESGQDAIYDYLETKSVWMAFNKDVPNPFVMR